MADLQIVPVPLPVTDLVVTETADLSSLELDPEKKYKVILLVDGKNGTQTASYEEIFTGPDEPAPDSLMVIRGRTTNVPFLVKKEGQFWAVGMSLYKDWNEVLSVFPATQWLYLAVPDV